MKSIDEVKTTASEHKDPLKDIENKMGELGNAITALDVEDVFLKRAKEELFSGLQEMQARFRTARQIFNVQKE